MTEKKITTETISRLNNAVKELNKYQLQMCFNENNNCLLLKTAFVDHFEFMQSIDMSIYLKLKTDKEIQLQALHDMLVHWCYNRCYGFWMSAKAEVAAKDYMFLMSAINYLFVVLKLKSDIVYQKTFDEIETNIESLQLTGRNFSIGTKYIMRLVIANSNLNSDRKELLLNWLNQCNLIYLTYIQYNANALHIADRDFAEFISETYDYNKAVMTELKKEENKTDIKKSKSDIKSDEKSK